MLTRIPQQSLRSGISGIRNGNMMLAAASHPSCVQADCIPVYRTAVGTGIGLGFGARR